MELFFFLNIKILKIKNSFVWLLFIYLFIYFLIYLFILNYEELKITLLNY